MTNEVTQYDSMATMLDVAPNYQAEVDTIVRFYEASKLMQEVALYRLFRLYINKEWDGNFDNATDFLDTMSSKMNVSVRLLYDRIKTYDIFSWMGVHGEMAVRKLTDNASLYSRVFQAVIKDWSLETHSPKMIAIPGLTDFNSQEAKDKVAALLTDSEAFTHQYEAIDAIKSNVQGGSTYKIYMKDNDDVIYIDYEIASIDATGQRQIDDYGFIKWLPENSATLPDEVIMQLRKRIEKR